MDQYKLSSDRIVQDVLKHNCRALVRRVPFFAEADSHVVGDVIRRLKNEFFQPGDEICAADSVGNRMFFLQSGNVAVTLKDGTVVAHLKDGSYFGGWELDKIYIYIFFFYLICEWNESICNCSCSSVLWIDSIFSATEMCLLRQEKRNASVIAEAYCTLYSLSIEDFNQVLESYPKLRQSMEEISEMRYLQNRQFQAKADRERASQLGLEIDRL